MFVKWFSNSLTLRFHVGAGAHHTHAIACACARAHTHTHSIRNLPDPRLQKAGFRRRAKRVVTHKMSLGQSAQWLPLGLKWGWGWGDMSQRSRTLQGVRRAPARKVHYSQQRTYLCSSCSYRGSQGQAASALAPTPALLQSVKFAEFSACASNRWDWGWPWLQGKL